MSLWKKLIQLWFQKAPRYLSRSSPWYVIGQWLGWGQEPWPLLVHLQQQDENQLLNECLQLVSSLTWLNPSSSAVGTSAMKKKSPETIALLASAQWEARRPEAKASWWAQEPIGPWSHSQSDESVAQEENQNSPWLSSRMERCQRRRWSARERALG